MKVFSKSVWITPAAWGFSPHSNGPLSYFIGTSGEKAAKMQRFPHGGDDLRKGRFDTDVLAFLSRSRLALKMG